MKSEKFSHYTSEKVINIRKDIKIKIIMRWNGRGKRVQDEALDQVKMLATPKL